MKHITFFIFMPILLLLASCSSTRIQSKVILDQSTPNRPNWTTSSKIAWESKGMIFLKATHTVQGNERANGCIDLAKLDAKEALISEIQNEVRGSLDNAQQSISENAENYFGQNKVC